MFLPPNDPGTQASCLVPPPARIIASGDDDGVGLCAVALVDDVVVRYSVAKSSTDMHLNLVFRAVPRGDEPSSGSSGSQRRASVSELSETRFLEWIFPISERMRHFMYNTCAIVGITVVLVAIAIVARFATSFHAHYFYSPWYLGALSLICISITLWVVCSMDRQQATHTILSFDMAFYSAHVLAHCVGAAIGLLDPSVAMDWVTITAVQIFAIYSLMIPMFECSTVIHPIGRRVAVWMAILNNLSILLANVLDGYERYNEFPWCVGTLCLSSREVTISSLFTVLLFQLKLGVREIVAPGRVTLFNCRLKVCVGDWAMRPSCAQSRVIQMRGHLYRIAVQPVRGIFRVTGLMSSPFICFPISSTLASLTTQSLLARICSRGAAGIAVVVWGVGHGLWWAAAATDHTIRILNTVAGFGLLWSALSTAASIDLRLLRALVRYYDFWFVCMCAVGELAGQFQAPEGILFGLAVYAHCLFTDALPLASTRYKSLMMVALCAYSSLSWLQLLVNSTAPDTNLKFHAPICWLYCTTAHKLRMFFSLQVFVFGLKWLRLHLMHDGVLTIIVLPISRQIVHLNTPAANTLPRGEQRKGTVPHPPHSPKPQQVSPTASTLLQVPDRTPSSSQRTSSSPRSSHPPVSGSASVELHSSVRLPGTIQQTWPRSHVNLRTRPLAVQQRRRNSLRIAKQILDARRVSLPEV